jgi:hypothetical protein
VPSAGRTCGPASATPATSAARSGSIDVDVVRQDAMAGVAISETYRIVQEIQHTQAQHTEVLGKILEQLDSIDARLIVK